MTTTTSRGALDEALVQARERYAAAHPASLAAHRAAAAAMPGGNTRSVLFHQPFPLTMARGAGCRLWDADENEYVDLLGEYTAGLFGHSNPVIRAAIDEALDGGWNLGGHGALEGRLARLICDRFPGIDLVRFTNSGTESNLMALGTAVAATGRRSVMVFDGAYHGGVLYFAGGGIPINVPHDWVICPYNDAAAATAMIEDHAEHLAAILVEPMLGSGGCIPAEGGFLETLKAGAEASGALLIFDEVMTSRMSGGGEQRRLGITPDLTTLGKYLGGGMSFGAFGGRAGIMERYDPRRVDAWPHAGTFNNNVLSMAAGVAGLSRIFTPEAADELFERGEAVRSRLNLAAGDLAMQWTGLGSLMTVHFQRAGISRASDIQPDGGLKELFFFDMLAGGFYLARRGMVALSLEIGADEIDGFCEAVEEFVERRQGVLSTRP
ncbi:MAG: aminotransferase class III-fold pyridoxal phosphate-dependent enzyme [Acidimicrobiales bacterium]|jgi:glutamate-1-semialdehyde 2,1-aminomutase